MRTKFTHRLANYIPVNADCFGTRLLIKTENFKAYISLPAPVTLGSRLGRFEWELFGKQLSNELRVSHQSSFDSSGPTTLSVEILGVDFVAQKTDAIGRFDQFFGELDLYFDTLGDYMLCEHGVVRDSTLDLVRRSTSYSRTRYFTLNSDGEVIEPPGSVNVNCSIHNSHWIRGGFLSLLELEEAFARVNDGYVPLAWKASLGEARRNFVAGQFRQSIALAGTAVEIYLSEPSLAKIDSRLDTKSRLSDLLEKQLNLGLISEHDKNFILNSRNDAAHSNRFFEQPEAENFISLVTRLTTTQVN